VKTRRTKNLGLYTEESVAVSADDPDFGRSLSEALHAAVPTAAAASNLQYVESLAQAVLAAGGRPTEWAQLINVPESSLSPNEVFAKRLLGYLRTVPEMAKSNETARALVDGMMMGTYVERIIANVHFEKAVREKRRRLDRSSAVSDDQIRAVLKRYSTRVEAAAELGLSPRQLRNRLKRKS
jgi:hypothetical protein